MTVDSLYQAGVSFTDAASTETGAQLRLGSFTVSPVGTVPLTVEQTAPVTTAGQLDLLCHTGAFATVDVTIAGAVHTSLANVSGDAVFNNLPIALGVLNVTVEAYVIPSVKTAVNHKVRYAGSARVWDLDDYYRATGHIQNLPTSKLGDALDDFGTVTSNDGDGLEVYGYDDANNIALVSTDGALHLGSSSVMNELESLGSLRTNIEYDERGNLVSFTEGGLLHVHTWNLRDQLIKVEKGVDVPGLKKVAEYSYYPDGMRAWKKVYDVTGTTITLQENYYGVGMSVHEVYSVSTGVESAQPVREYVFEGLDRPVVMFTNADANGGTGFQGREPYFFHTNPRGDVYALTNEAGAIVERVDYTLNGVPTVMDAAYNVIPGSLIGNDIYSGGMFYDPETGLYQVRFRYLDPVTGNFLSRDPAEDDSLGNLYAGFERNAGMYTDPMGLEAVEGGVTSIEALSKSINHIKIKCTEMACKTERPAMLSMTMSSMLDRSKSFGGIFSSGFVNWLNEQKDAIEKYLFTNDSSSHYSTMYVLAQGLSGSNDRPRYVYSQTYGWLDFAHLLATASASMKVGAEKAFRLAQVKEFIDKYKVSASGEVVELGGGTNSSYEDMPSEYVGALFGQYLRKKCDELTTKYAKEIAESSRSGTPLPAELTLNLGDEFIAWANLSKVTFPEMQEVTYEIFPATRRNLNSQDKKPAVTILPQDVALSLPFYQFKKGEPGTFVQGALDLKALNKK